MLNLNVQIDQSSMGKCIIANSNNVYYTFAGHGIALNPGNKHQNHPKPLDHDIVLYVNLTTTRPTTRDQRDENEG